jgi:hypothetical protein
MSVVDIYLKAHNEASAVIKSVDADLAKMGGGALNTSTLLKTLGSAAVVGAVAKVGQMALDAVLGLDAMREKSEQISARFEAQAGSTRNAAEALGAMNAIVGNALTNDEKMAESGQLMALGLAKSSTEAANLTNIAVGLGNKTQDAAGRVEGLTQIMVSGRLRGLTQYGISMTEVSTRAAQMQTETVGLTDIQAKQNAIMEIGTRKLNDYVTAGGTAITKTQALKKAWEDYQDALANNVNLGKAKNFLTEGVTAARINLQIESADPLEQLTGLEAKLRDIQQIRDDFKGNPISLFFAGGGGFGAQAEVDGIIAKIAYLKQSMADSGDVGAGVFTRLAGGAQDAGDEVDAAAEAVVKLDAALAGLKGKEEAAKVNAVAAAIMAGDMDRAAVAVMGLNAAFIELNKNKLGPSLGPEYYAGLAASGTGIPNVNQPQAPAGPAYGRGTDLAAQLLAAQQATGVVVSQTAREVQTAYDALGKSSTTAAKATQAAWESALSAIASAAESQSQRAADAIKGLLPEMNLGGSDQATDPNGPYRDMRRAADVARLGQGSPWAAQIAAQLGVSPDEVQAKAKETITAFAQGFRTPEVRKLIDEAMLVDQTKQAEAAKASLDSWGKEIAKAAGVNPNLKSGGAAVFDASFGADKKTGKNAAAEAAAQSASTLMVDALGSKLKDEAGRAIGFGNTIWGNIETGLVDSAKKSGSLRAAVGEMVAAFLNGQPAGAPPSGGVGKTSKSGGAKL